jgi:molecular chaperone GrpE
MNKVNKLTEEQQNKENNQSKKEQPASPPKKETQKTESKPETSIKEKIFGGKKNNADEKVRELTEALQRLQAEFENYQKRSTKQNEEYKNYANAKLIEHILPVLDSIEAGIEHNKDLKIIYDQLNSVLKKQGLDKIEIKKSEAFDHDKMECLMQEKNPALGDHTVANVLMNGYLLNGKILRLAKVSVNILEKAGQCENDEEKAEQTEKSEKTGAADEKLTKIDYEVKKMEE